MAKSGKKSRKILFVFEIVLLLLFIGGLFVYGQINAKLNKISTPPAEEFDREQVKMNDTAPELKGYTNVALFALDHRAKTESAGGENSDTIIIASIDNDSKDVKLASVYRDTLLDIGDDTYQKCNAAYAKGGPQQALSMLNTNLDMNIQNYATVDFTAMVKAIDMLGGLDIPLTYQEMVHMNNYCVETSEETETDYTPLELPDPKPEDETEILGVYHLGGVQATSYCRIRYTASLDFGRTERQRLVIQLMAQKAKKASIGTLSKIMDEVFPYVETSFTKTEIMQMAMSMLSYKVDQTTGFPKDMKMATLESKGSVVIPDSLESNVRFLHEFLFPKESYTPSETVLARSRTIENLSDEESISDLQKALEDESSAGIQVTPDPGYVVPTQPPVWVEPTQPPVDWVEPTQPPTEWYPTQAPENPYEPPAEWIPTPYPPVDGGGGGDWTEPPVEPIDPYPPVDGGGGGGDWVEPPIDGGGDWTDPGTGMDDGDIIY